jgi:hypothetical protein
VDVTGLEPATPCLQRFPARGINNLHCVEEMLRNVTSATISCTRCDKDCVTIGCYLAKNDLHSHEAAGLWKSSERLCKRRKESLRDSIRKSPGSLSGNRTVGNRPSHNTMCSYCDLAAGEASRLIRPEGNSNDPK